MANPSPGSPAALQVAETNAPYAVNDLVKVRCTIVSYSGQTLTLAVESPLSSDTTGLTVTAYTMPNMPKDIFNEPLALGNSIQILGLVTGVTGIGAYASVALTLQESGFSFPTPSLTVAGSQVKSVSNDVTQNSLV